MTTGEFRIEWGTMPEEPKAQEPKKTEIPAWVTSDITPPKYYLCMDDGSGIFVEDIDDVTHEEYLFLKQQLANKRGYNVTVNGYAGDESKE